MKINNQILMLNITQTEGDFAWLQKQIDAAKMERQIIPQKASRDQHGNQLEQFVQQK